MSKPRRLSMGRYVIAVCGQQIILQRCGRQGFKVVMRQGAISPIYRRLRDAAAAAIQNFSPWPFPVEKRPDLEADLPQFLDRRRA